MMKSGFVSTLAALATLAAPYVVGCNNVTSSRPSAAYGREAPAIGLARTRAAEANERAAKANEVPMAPPPKPAPAALEVAPPPPPTVAAVGQIKHVVVVWLKKPGDAAARKSLVDAATNLRQIPGVIDVAAGDCMPSDRKVVDSSYDVALVVTLADLQSLKNYGGNPIHQQLLKDVLMPNADHYVVYDFAAR